MSVKLERAQAEVSRHMDDILRCFLPGAKITVLVRNPVGESEPGSQDFLMTNDDLAEAGKVIERRIAAHASAHREQLAERGAA